MNDIDKDTTGKETPKGGGNQVFPSRYGPDIIDAFDPTQDKVPLEKYFEVLLEGEKCNLRPIRNNEQDIATITQLANDPFIFKKRLYRTKECYTKSDAQYFVDNIHRGRRQNEKICFGIEYEGHLAGQVSITRNVLKDDRAYANTAFVGMRIGAPYRGKGLSSDALKLLCDHVLEFMPDLTRIEARILTGNTIMPPILLKAGFSHEATLHQRIEFQGKIRDEHMYVILIPIDPARKA